MEMMPKFLERIAALLCRNSEEKSLEKKRKHLDDFLFSSTSIPKDASGEPAAAAKSSDIEMFDALDS
jgi:hypothetical protein